jgi:hypothetical protein
MLFHGISEPLVPLIGVVPLIAVCQPPIPGKSRGPGALVEPGAFFVVKFEF